jgi:hypothetical protein
MVTNHARCAPAKPVCMISASVAPSACFNGRDDLGILVGSIR